MEKNIQPHKNLTFRCTDDNNIDIDESNLADLLEKAGKTWKTYQQNYPGNCYKGTELVQGGLHLYERKHNPFMSFLSISQNTTRCANIVDETQLDKDIASQSVPNYVIYTPNQINDGHGANYSVLVDTKTLEYSRARIAVGDKWLSTFVPPLMSNPYFSDTLFMITFDENDVTAEKDTTDNLIYTVVFGAGVQNGTTDGTFYNHYSQLALLEAEWGLGSLGRKDVGANPFMLSGTGPSSKNSGFAPSIELMFLAQSEMALKDILKEKIIDGVLRQINPPGRWKILVVDPESLLILDSSCKMSEVLNENPWKDYSRKDRMYQAAHVFCLSPLSDLLFNRIKSSGAKQYIRTLRELNIDFTAPEPNYFSLDTTDAWYNIYNPDAPSLLSFELTKMAKKIVSVLANLGEYPYIRYHSKPQAFQTSPQKSLSGELAHLVQAELDELCREDQSFPPPSKYPKAILLVLDRRIDCIAPLIHEVSYQAMLGDLGGLFNGKYHDDKDDKDHILDETDIFWAQVRTWHISEVMEFVQEKFNKFKEENKAAQWEIGARGNDASGNIQQLKDVMNSFGDYQKTKEFVARHLNICLTLSKTYADRNLADVADLEHKLSTTDPKDSKFSKLLGEVEKALQNQSVDHLDKVRLALLTVIAHEGISDSDRNRFLEMARFHTSESQALTNLNMLGVKLSPNFDKRKNEPNNPFGPSNNARRCEGKKVDFDNAKYTPTISYIIQDQIKGNLDTNWFPWVKEAAPEFSSVNSAQPGSAAAPAPRINKSWATRKVNTPSAQDGPPPPPEDLRQNGPRIIVFMLGGATYSEIKALVDIQKQSKREVLLGSTFVWSPDGFVEGLKDLDRRGMSGQKFLLYKRPAPKVIEPRRKSSRGRDEYYEDEQDDRYRRQDSRGDRRAPPPRRPPVSSHGSPPQDRDRATTMGRAERAKSPPARREKQEPLYQTMGRVNMGDRPTRGNSGSDRSDRSDRRDDRGWLKRQDSGGDREPEPKKEEKKKNWFGF
ncbi:vacuolar sorting protein VPS33/slp1 [Terramyces sp. JEL0728]|nr:vacuolar sorting protein VPS33/slp1 [Terramyces sp. JEL0728]